MSRRKSGDGGSSHDRRTVRRKDEPAAPPPAAPPKIHEGRIATASGSKKSVDSEATQRRNDLLALVGIGLTFLSWGSTALPWQTSPWLGSGLLCAAATSFLYGLWRVWKFRRIWFVLPALLVVAASLTLDWFGIVKPQRGKPFEDLLVEGYHLVNECESIPGHTEMPVWMRDQSQAWQSRVLQLIEERLGVADAGTWEKAVVVGTVNDASSNGYQCLWLGNKVAALELIVASAFEPNLKHRDAVGPTYWVNAVNGEIDVTDIFKDGDKSARLYVNGAGAGTVRVRGHIPGLQNGTISFKLDPP